MHLAGAFLASMCLSLIGTFYVRGWARRRGYVDVPDQARHLHATSMPRVGGVAIALVTTGTFLFWAPVIGFAATARPELVTMLAGGLMMFGVGLWDDIKQLDAWTKFSLQFLIAIAVFAGGVRIPGASLGGFWQGDFTLLVSLLVTTVWIVGVSNAFNLIDGSDGVSAGAALFASTSLGLVFALNADPLGMLMCSILVGSCFGFLFFNFPPASIFLGDGGSLFLGYTLATLGVITTQTSSTIVAVVIPVVAFGVPLLDTFIAIVRRFLGGRPVFSPDRGHIHHRLHDLGHSPRAVAITLYIACAAFASLSLLLAVPGRPAVLPVLLVAATILVVGVQRLNVPEIAELLNVVGRGFQQREVIAHNLRLHAGCEALTKASDPETIIEALQLAFHGSEFARLEAWVDAGLGGGLRSGGEERVSRDGSGYLLSLSFEDATSPEVEVEIRVAIWSDGERVGRLSLFRRGEGRRLFTDVRLVPQRLIPALVGALERTRLHRFGTQHEQHPKHHAAGS